MVVLYTANYPYTDYLNIQLYNLKNLLLYICQLMYALLEYLSKVIYENRWMLNLMCYSIK